MKGYVQTKFESVPGNESNSPTLSDKVIYDPVLSVGASYGTAHMNRDDEVRNEDEPVELLPENFSPEWSQSQRAYPDSTAVDLKHIFGDPVITAGDGVITDPDEETIPATAYRMVWTAPYGPSGSSPMTTQKILAYDAEGTYFKAKGAAMSSLALNFQESGGILLETGGPALYLNRIANPSLTPAYESLAIKPFHRGGMQIATWLSGSADPSEISVSVDNPVEALRSMGIPSKYPDKMEKASGLITITGSVTKAHLDADDIDALVNATTFPVKIKWESDSVIGATSYKYSLWLEGTAQYTDGDLDALTNDRRHGGSFGFKMVKPVAGTPSSKWTLVCATASLS